MNDIFSNLAMRNFGLPSPEVLQPRLPSLFEPSNPVDGLPESILDQPFSLQPQAAGRIEAEQPGTLSFDRESPSPSNMLIQDSSIINIYDPSHGEQFSRQPGLESAREKTIQRSAQSRQLQTPSESIHSSSFNSSLEDTQNDQYRSATIMSDSERISDRANPNDPHRESVNVGEHIVHPRTERVTANKVARLVEPSRDEPGRVDKSMDVLKPREESNRAEPPVVRIHIGRIDVRAVTPPPSQPASKPAPAQPRLTLDDYLRQREGHR